jgi:hypothetical protein
MDAPRRNDVGQQRLPGFVQAKLLSHGKALKQASIGLLPPQALTLSTWAASHKAKGSA